MRHLAKIGNPKSPGLMWGLNYRSLIPLTGAETADGMGYSSAWWSVLPSDNGIVARAVADYASHFGLWSKEQQEAERQPCHVQVVE
jgi:hypothetical protein